MKNLISPETLAQFKQNPTPLKEIVNFLDTHPDISTATLCRLEEIPPRQIYDYRYSLQQKKGDKKIEPGVAPKNLARGHNRYTAEEKFELIEKYISSSDGEKGALLRTYGIYLSDITKWREQAKEASLAALGKRKVRADKKSDEQVKIESLEKDLAEQEKTTAKLSTLLILQKKTFDLLSRKD